MKSISKECIKYLPNAPIEIKYDLTSKLVNSILKFSSSYKWEIDTLIKMVIVSDSKLYDDALSKIINCIMSIKELFIYSVHKLYICLKNNEENKALNMISFYVIGENGRLLIDNEVLNSKNQNIKVTEDEVIELFKKIGKINYEKGNYEVLEYLLNAYVKLLLKFPSKRNIIEDDILNYQKSFYCEVQQRAIEYKIFYNQKDDLKKNIVKSIPIPKTKDENLELNRDIINEKDEEENIKDEDPNTLIKLSSLNIPTSNPMDDILQDNGNNNNNTNKNNNELNLLDLNNIFGNNPSSINNNQPNNNPIDLFGNTNNNNQPNNNPIDLFSNTNNSNESNHNPIDLLGNSNNNNQSNNNETTQENKIDNLLNLMGGMSNNYENTNNNNNLNPFDINMNNNQSNPSSNILENIEEKQIPVQNEESELKQCFINDDISLYYKITQSKENPLFYNGEVIASNNSKNPIDNIKINFLVLKFITLKIGEVTGSHLEPNQLFGLKKTFTLQSNAPNKKIIIKIKLSYVCDGKEQTIMITLDNI